MPPLGPTVGDTIYLLADIYRQIPVLLQQIERLNQELARLTRIQVGIEADLAKILKRIEDQRVGKDKA